jgi:hypothetical protein
MPDVKFSEMVSSGNAANLDGAIFRCFVSVGGVHYTAPIALMDARFRALATQSATGDIPALSGSATEYLNGSGAWSTPAGGGGGDLGDLDDVTITTAAEADLIVRNDANVWVNFTAGAAGTVLTSGGPGAPLTWTTPSGSGDVVKDGTMQAEYIAVWTGDGTLGGSGNFMATAGGTVMIIAGSVTADVLYGTALTDGQVCAVGVGKRIEDAGFTASSVLTTDNNATIDAITPGTVADADLFLWGDATDSWNLKTSTGSQLKTFFGGGGGASWNIRSVSSADSPVTPAAMDWLICDLTTGNIQINAVAAPTTGDMLRVTVKNNTAAIANQVFFNNYTINGTTQASATSMSLWLPGEHLCLADISGTGVYILTEDDRLNHGFTVYWTSGTPFTAPDTQWELITFDDDGTTAVGRNPAGIFDLTNNTFRLKRTPDEAFCSHAIQFNVAQTVREGWQARLASHNTPTWLTDEGTLHTKLVSWQTSQTNTGWGMLSATQPVEDVNNTDYYGLQVYHYGGADCRTGVGERPRFMFRESFNN